MASILRVLGQSYPAAATETDLYACGTNSAVISTLTICNKSGSADAVTVRIAVAGVASVDKQLIVAGTNLAANSTMSMTIGITLAHLDVVRVTSTNGTTAFNIFGQENA